MVNKHPVVLKQYLLAIMPKQAELTRNIMIFQFPCLASRIPFTNDCSAYSAQRK